MKKLLAILLCLCMVLSLAACAGKSTTIRLLMGKAQAKKLYDHLRTEDDRRVRLACL